MEQETGIALVQNENFLKKTYHGALFPCILSILSGCINILADGILVGQRIGATGLAAINLCVPVYLVLCIVGSFLVSGATICASQELGKNQPREAGRFYRIALTACIVSSAVITLCGIPAAGRISAFLCKDPAVFPMVRDYTWITLAGAFPRILLYVPFWFLRLDGKNQAVTVMMAIMAVGNVILDIVFLYALNMGVSGAALASVTATLAACVFGFVRLHGKGSSFSARPAVPGREEARRIAAAGSPAAVNNLFQTLRLLCMNAMLLEFGGSAMVAGFTVVNGISAFAEAVTAGVPQAGSALLGILHGERDNASTSIVIRREIKSGVLCCVIFGMGIVAGADVIARAYGMDAPMRIPMLCLALSLIPSLLNNILSGYYNASGYAWLSNLIIFFRVMAGSVLSLFLLLEMGGLPWAFLITGELITLAVWLIATGQIHRKNDRISRYLLLDQTLEKQGRVINFSIGSDPERICDASEKIKFFCEDNGMQPGQVLRISLALEEIMTLITAINEPEQVFFDIRVFSAEGKIGVRFRYNGKKYNPLQTASEENDLYMGIRMICRLVDDVCYQNMFGMNTLLILL